ncbi:hypothetical protein M422DRAFT_41380 [Sphaerobolus stellatus SS14]|nr:hypothetical protein M422DRAFT_41380 [Sphaerobolus stellatus SS14]
MYSVEPLAWAFTIFRRNVHLVKVLDYNKDSEELVVNVYDRHDCIFTFWPVRDHWGKAELFRIPERSILAVLPVEQYPFVQPNLTPSPTVVMRSEQPMETLERDWKAIPRRINKQAAKEALDEIKYLHQQDQPELYAEALSLHPPPDDSESDGYEDGDSTELETSSGAEELEEDAKDSPRLSAEMRAAQILLSFHKYDIRWATDGPENGQ